METTGRPVIAVKDSKVLWVCNPIPVFHGLTVGELANDDQMGKNGSKGGLQSWFWSDPCLELDTQYPL